MRKPYYGWIVVAVCFLIGITEAGVFQSIYSLFMKPMVQEFGWSRASVTGAMAFGSICGGALSPIIGPVMDRRGPRMMSFLGILLMSAGMAAMMSVTRLWQLYLFFGAGRMIAVGMLRLTVSISISNWFIHLRGRAMGIAKIGDHIGSALLPLLVQFFILYLGWRMAWGSLGAVVFVLSGIPTFFLLHRSPEDLGLLPDGAQAEEEERGHPAGAATGSQGGPRGSEPLWTRTQALRTRAFWAITLLHCLLPFMQAGTNFHIYPFLTDQGIHEATAVLVLTTIAIFGTIGSIIWGILSEKFRLQDVLAVNLIGNGLLFLALYWVIEHRYHALLGVGSVFVLAALHGAFNGGRNLIITLIWVEFFGRQSLGSIFSMATPFHAVSNALGPIFAAYCFDLYGSYTLPFYIFIFIYFLSGVITRHMEKPPQPPDGTPSSM